MAKKELTPEEKQALYDLGKQQMSESKRSRYASPASSLESASPG